MDLYDFNGFIDDFKRSPPLHEVARAHVLLPGDEGYKKEVPNAVKSNVLRGIAPNAGEAPDWFKRGAERLLHLVPPEVKKTDAR